MKKILILFALMVSLNGFAKDNIVVIDEQQVDLVLEMINQPSFDASTYSEAELQKVESMFETLGSKKAHCCYGTNGPSMRCRTPMRSSCDRKPGCYWNC